MYSTKSTQTSSKPRALTPFLLQGHLARKPPLKALPQPILNLLITNVTDLLNGNLPHRPALKPHVRHMSRRRHTGSGSIATEPRQPLKEPLPGRGGDHHNPMTMRHALELLDDDRRAGLVHAARENESFIREPLLAHGDEDRRGALPQLRRRGERRDERVAEDIRVGVHVDARRGGGPGVVGREGERSEGRAIGRVVGCLLRAGEVVEFGVVEGGRHRARDVAPRGDGGDSGWELGCDGLVVEAEGVRCALQGEEGLQQDEGEVPAGGIAGDDDLVGGDGVVQGAWWRVDQGEVCCECVDESCWEGVLRGESVSDGEDGGAGESRQVRDGDAVRARVHHAVDAVSGL